ncbi:MAG TPA: OmpA family protein, partial [bacterium]|nr:OmpA family protein [bacterium]
RIGDFSPSFDLVSAAYALNIKDRMLIGVNYKRFRENYGAAGLTDSVSSLTDAGMLFKFFRGKIRAGAALRNMGLEKSDLQYGLAFNFFSEEHTADFAFDISRINEDMIISMEHLGMDTLYLRAGYLITEKKNYLDSMSLLRAGLGIKFNTVTLDYAWIPQGNLGTAHQVSLTYRGNVPSSREPRMKVSISAAPFLISPNNDGEMDRMEIRVMKQGEEPVESWTFTVYNSSSVPVRIMTGEAELPEKIYWEGEDMLEEILPDGEYSSVFQVMLKKYPVPLSTPEERLIIDNTPPLVMVRGTESFTPDGDGRGDTATFSLLCSDNYRIKKWLFKIIWKDKLVKSFEGGGFPPETLVWDGQDSTYEKPVQPGEYEYKLILWDSAGNSSKSETMTIKAEASHQFREIRVEEEESGLKVNLKSSLLFKKSDAALSPDAWNSLDEVIMLINNYPKNKISIEGHTDSVGNNETNKKLSEMRA